MATAITIISLAAEGSANQIALTWAVEDPNIGGLPYLQFSHAEIRYADNEAMTGAATLTDSAQYAYNHMNLDAGAEFWYQARAVDREGQEGEWCDPVNGQEVSLDSGAVASAWDDFSPTIEAASGTLTAYTLGTCRQKQAGLLQFFTVDFTVDNAGTANGLIVKGIPNATQATLSASGYREVTAGSPDVWTPDMALVVTVAETTTSPAGVLSEALIMAYDGSNAAATGRRYTITGFFEVAP